MLLTMKWSYRDKTLSISTMPVRIELFIFYEGSVVDSSPPSSLHRSLLPTFPCRVYYKIMNLICLEWNYYSECKILSKHSPKRCWFFYLYWIWLNGFSCEPRALWRQRGHQFQDLLCFFAGIVCHVFSVDSTSNSNALCAVPSENK